jgi:plasmid maintenance system killer protein
MIQTFVCTETERFFATGKSRRLPPEILKRAAMRLIQLDSAIRVEDLRLLPPNRLEALTHDRVRHGVFASMTSGVSVSVLKPEMRTMLKSLITIEEK